MLRSQSGQALIESVIALSGAVVLLGALLALMVPLFAQLWGRHSIYEGLICLAERRPSWECRSQATARIRTAIPFAKIKSLKLQETKSGYWGSFRLCLPFHSFVDGTVEMPIPRPQRGSF